MMEFHISRRTREKFQFDPTLFSYDGNVIFANFHAVRQFVQKVNSQHDLINFPEQSLKASQVNAMGLIDEIFHHIFHLYRQQKQPKILTDALNFLQQSVGTEELDNFLETFIFEYPPSPVFSSKQDPAKYLADSTQGVPNRQLVLEELIVLWLAVENPALEPFAELFIEKNFISTPIFSKVFNSLGDFFEDQPKFGPGNQPLVQMLHTPAVVVPDSLTGQLEYIREHWSSLLGDYLYRLLSSLDLIKEENKLGFLGPGPVPIPVYDQAEFLRAGATGLEPEAFSQDREWMPRLVLIAKNTYVWLDQLSRKYQRAITRLDQIPPVELETLSRWGITGLWLIGLWERSPASARIKQLCGNTEAISSAYSLYSYQIASDLGGEAAYETLRENAARYGVRLASDMVPNHMGIDSEWMIHHPERFLSLDHCPYPSYSFTGEDLSSDPAVTIQIEDHYYDRTDAAVVFSRRDNSNGRVKYIYHGNDGTSMPWNDTAQLDYLNPEVREAVIQTILEVARRFPIIRFDAAMTLARKHYQRLWFPQPGSGGAIPSRAEHGITQQEFDRAMPLEFWREVVDRAAVEAPDTLLLAEAFWLMEGYFVRTLGMHRVYNSAFMHMLRNEDNAGYRKLIKNTLEFEPEILKRYVNFMNNPDERTAVDQFGKGDKYFGVCMLMAALPGLPMLGHGQIEGFAEKYGMEFRKPNWDEQVDPDLVARHEREIFPLFHQRRLFAGVENFNLFDFFALDGNFNENVFAFTNHQGGNSALVIYNNNYSETEGTIHFSARKMRKIGSETRLEQTALYAALKLTPDRTAFIVFRDQITGLSYLRPAGDLLDRGLQFKLRGFEYHAFLDFRVVTSDAAHDYASLYSLIGDKGVPEIEHSLSELFLHSIIDPFKQIIDYGYLNYLMKKSFSGAELEINDREDIRAKITDFLVGIKKHIRVVQNIDDLSLGISELVCTVLQLPGIRKTLYLPGSEKTEQIADFLLTPLMASKGRWMTLFAWAVVSQIGKLQATDQSEELTLSWMDEWQLGKYFRETLAVAGCQESEIQKLYLSLKIGIAQQNWDAQSKGKSLKTVLQQWLSEPEIQYFLQINRYNDILWYNRESFDELAWWLAVIPFIKTASDKKLNASKIAEKAISLYDFLTALKKLEKNSQFQIAKLISLSEKVRV